MKNQEKNRKQQKQRETTKCHYITKNKINEKIQKKIKRHAKKTKNK